MTIVRIFAAAFLAAVLWTLQAAPCPAAGWETLKDIVQTFEVNGRDVRVILHPRLRTVERDGRLAADLEIRGDLNEFRSIAPSLVLWRQPLEILNTALVLRGRDLTPDPPGVLAQGDLFLEGTEESTGLRARLVPEIVDNAIRLRALPVGGPPEGALGAALAALGLDQVNPLLYLLNRYFSGPGSALGFPPEFQAYKPVYRSASFGDPGGGGLGVLVEAGFDLAPGQREDLIRALAALGD